MNGHYTIQDFPHKRDRETVIIVVRRHWWVMLKFVLVFVFQLLVGAAVVVLLLMSGAKFQSGSPAELLLVLFGSLYVLFVWAFFFHNWVDYYLDVWIVTDERILNIVQNGLFSRTVSELSMANVQDVTSELRGKMQTFLDFGDVHIQSAGERERFLFDNVGNPEGISARIVELHEAAVARQGGDVSFSQATQDTTPRSTKSRSV